MYKRADKEQKPEVKDIHVWFGERIHKDSVTIVDVTVCGWINPPAEQLTHDKYLATCESCKRRAK